MNKQKIVDLANLELARIAGTSLGEFSIALDAHGRISGSDESGYYPAKNYRQLLAELSEFESGVISDPLYDGEDSHLWAKLWSLFDD